MGSCLSTSASDRPWRSSASSSASSASSKTKKGGKKMARSYSRDESLSRILGRRFSNGASSVASLFTQQGKKGTNQDAMIVWENFCSRSDTIFCGVFDGHGPFGHMVARRVRDSLPQKLSPHFEVNVTNNGFKENNSINTAASMNSEESSSLNLEESRVSMDFEEKEKHQERFMGLKQSFLKAFKLMDKELRLHPNIDCFCSGTTAVTLVKQGCDLIIGNVGDSRAILGTRDQDDYLIAVQLTVDLKPNLPMFIFPCLMSSTWLKLRSPAREWEQDQREEAERIRRCKGRVFALQDEPEVARVWLPNNNSPGLAMSRAFGDFCLKDFGLISVPDISYRRITERDEFIVLATDGVWDALSNEEVITIVASSPNRSYAARSLVEAAIRSWRIKYPTSKVDDCAVVCLFLNSEENSPNSCTKEACNGLSPNSPEAEADESTELYPSSPTSLDRSATLRSSGILLENNMEIEGVSRVDTLLTLPRFVPNKSVKKSA